MESKHSQIYSRAVELSSFIEFKYLSLLEDILVEEAMINSKPVKTSEDLLRLVGLKAMKKHILEELGVPYREYEDKLLEDLLGEISVIVDNTSLAEMEA
ncbi:MAG: hypothetical protein J7L82_00740 [Staphylothermus sp.]|nr:hypothetical protein [Staphylothermus sp.]